MKILNLSILFFLCGVMLHAQESFSIKGNISDIEEGTKIELFRRVSNSQTSIGENLIENGLFSFEGTMDKPVEQLFIAIYKYGMPFFSKEVWVAPNTTTTISGKGLFVDVWGVESTVKEQQELNKYTDINKEDLLTRQILIENIIELMGKLRATKKEDEATVLSKQLDSIHNIMKPVSRRIAEKEIDLLKNSTPSPVWISKLQSQAFFAKDPTYPMNMQMVKELYNKLSGDLKESEEAKLLRAQIFPPEHELIGKKAIDANLRDMDGNYKRLADYRGKFVLVDFWASWCGPCLAAIPEMKEIELKYKDSLTIVGINLDGKDDVWKAATEKHKLTWANLTEGKAFGQGLHAEYKGQGIPYYVLISPEGTVLDIWAGYRSGDLEKRISKHIK